MNLKRIYQKRKVCLLTILLICIFNFSGRAQITCSDFTITGTSPSSYFLSQGISCTISPIPVGQVLWTESAINGVPNGFVKHTFNNQQTDVSIWYTVVNDNDFGTITVNGGGAISLSLVSGCASLSGNILGPYNGTGHFGDVLVNIQSTMPFTEVTLVNTGGQSGHCTGDCNSVIINNSCNIQLGADTVLCQGETLTLDATTPNASYLWQDNSTNSTYNVTQQGTYWVEVTVNNCTATDTIQVNYNPLPTFDLGADTVLCQGETLTLDATTPNASYLWQDNSTNSKYSVAQQGTYWVEATVNNCTATDTILIIEENCQIILEIPNVFTPNNDGINDLFVPLISKGIVSMNTIIYNRWGSEIYQTNNLLIEWNGQGVSDGTYFWIVYSTDKNGNDNILNGFVTILK